MQQELVREIKVVKILRAQEAKKRYEKAVGRLKTEESHEILRTFQIDDFILRKRIRLYKLEPVFDGLFKITNTTPTNNYKLRAPSSFTLLRSYAIDRLAPAVINNKLT